MSWTLLEGPDGGLIRSIVLSDGSEELTPIERDFAPPELPAAFEARADAELCAELHRRRSNTSCEVLTLPLLGFVSEVSDEHDREPLALDISRREVHLVRVAPTP